MIYVTGDTHRHVDSLKLKYHKMQEEDFLIVCGDFGWLWDDSEFEHASLDLLDKMPGTILFVDGNHENFPLIFSFPEEEWHGGRVHKIRPSILHLMRGEVFDIEGKKIFVFGGGTSIDKEFRIEGISWWPEELPSETEYKNALASLDKVDWKVDYVCTHAAPTLTHYEALDKLLILNPLKGSDALTDFLQEVDNRLDYKMWYFGHYHGDIQVSEKHRLLYDSIIPIEEATE